MPMNREIALRDHGMVLIHPHSIAGSQNGTDIVRFVHAIQHDLQVGLTTIQCGATARETIGTQDLLPLTPKPVF